MVRWESEYYTDTHDKHSGKSRRIKYEAYTEYIAISISIYTSAILSFTNTYDTSLSFH